MSSPAPLRVAITGAGPAGLGPAIALSQLPGVEVEVYERATELREKWTYRRARGEYQRAKPAGAITAASRKATTTADGATGASEAWLVFEDGEAADAELIVGGDGIRSAARDAV
nr:hypothetical protein B0A51_14191 [Rachicladosporium sp. CCFEE 5018]